MKQLFFAQSKDGKLIFRNNKELKDHLTKLGNKELSVEIVPYKHQRTLDQNAALHLWYTKVAEELNNAGYTVQLALKERIDLDWTPRLVKELMWRPAQKAILKKKSTTELAKLEEIDLVWEHLNRHLGEKFGIHIPFPSQSYPHPQLD